jgi:hypothetical protein
MTGLLTDLYQLTMAAGYFEAGKSREKATFELSATSFLPPGCRKPSNTSRTSDSPMKRWTT